MTTDAATSQPGARDATARAAHGGAGTPAGDRGEQAQPPPGASGVVDLDAGAGDATQLGHKAARLARLVAEGFPVPRGVVLPVALVDALVAACEGAPTPEAVRAAGVPERLRAAVTEAVAVLGDGPLAVRSSAVAEDTDDASYAGLYETMLGVRGVQETLDAVRRCAASAFADRVSAYRAPGDAGAGTAVLIQRLVDADAAGVAFTANPVTGHRDEILVSGVPGLGDQLVAGQASADEWLVRGGQARCLTAPEGALDAGTVRAVAALAARLEELAGTPQDIEWALADGRVHLLQARPVTALPAPPQIEPPPGSWMKDTMHYTGPISPLAATAYLPRLQGGGNRAFVDFGFLIGEIRQAAIGWEVYMQAVPPDEETAARRIDTAVEALRANRPQAQLDRWWDGGWRQEFTDRIEALRRVGLSDLDDNALDAHLQACLDLLADGQVAHFQLFAPYLLAVFDLATAGEELLGWSLPEALELVAGLSEASAAPTLDLAALAADIRARPAAAEAVTGWAPGQPWEQVLARLRDADPDLARRLADHRDRYGCRVPAYDVGDPTYGERPELILRLLRDLVTGTQDPLAVRDELDRRREQAAERARAVLDERDASAAQRDRFAGVLARAERAWGAREDNLLVTDHMPNGLVRLAALEAGRRLVARGRLRRAEDPVWLELGELRAALTGADGTGTDGTGTDGTGTDTAADLRQRVTRRRCEHAWVRAHPGPPGYGDPPPPPPPMDGLPPEAQRLAGALGWMMATEFGPTPDEVDADALSGQPGSPGRVTATARVLRDETEFDRLGVGEVLVCGLTTPAWTALFARAAAVVTDIGSPLSHAAIVAREHGIPAVVGTRTATTSIGDGQTITVDGARGVVSFGPEPGGGSERTDDRDDAPSEQKGART